MPKPQQRTLIHGGEVVTQNDRREIHEALVLQGNTVLATGSVSDMRSLAGVHARAVDVRGGCVLPGIIDNHPHALHFGSFDADCVLLYDARDHADILARIRQRAAVTPHGQWIITTPVGEPHYFVRRSWQDLLEGRLPHRKELDSAAPDHPVWIQAYAPRIPNVCAMNSKALEVLGFTRDLPRYIDDVFVGKDDGGELTGIFSGYVTNYYNSSMFWLTQVTAKVLRASDDFWYRGALAGQVAAARRGVTTVYEGHAMDPPHIAAYQRVRDEGRLTMRVLASLEAAPFALDLGLGVTDEIVRENFALAVRLRQTVDPLFRVNGLTIGKGAPGWDGLNRLGRTYSDPYGRPTRGRQFVSSKWERDAIEHCLRHNVRLNILQSGHDDHRDFVAALGEFLGDWDVRAREWIVQHSIFIDDATIERYADWRFHFTSTVSFCWGEGDTYRDRMGKNVMNDLLPIGKMFASGANVGLGGDWGPHSPFEHIALAETRELAASGARHDGPGYSITRQQALDGWTINNARLMQWENIGALKPGYKADLVIVDRNPLAGGVGEVSKTEVLRTVVDGKDVFDTGSLARLDDSALTPDRLQPALKFDRDGEHVCSLRCTH